LLSCQNHLNCPQEIKKKIQTKRNKKRKTEERRVLPTGMGLRTIRNTFLVNYFVKTQFKKKKKINRRKKKTKPNKYAKKEEITAISWTPLQYTRLIFADVLLLTVPNYQLLNWQCFHFN